MPNGAGYMPYEDVPRDLGEEDEEEVAVCDNCGGEMSDKLIGDEYFPVCRDCNN